MEEKAACIEITGLHFSPKGFQRKRVVAAIELWLIELRVAIGPVVCSPTCSGYDVLRIYFEEIRSLELRYHFRLSINQDCARL